MQQVLSYMCDVVSNFDGKVIVISGIVVDASYFV